MLDWKRGCIKERRLYGAFLGMDIQMPYMIGLPYKKDLACVYFQSMHFSIYFTFPQGIEGGEGDSGVEGDVGLAGPPGPAGQNMSVRSNLLLKMLLFSKKILLVTIVA